MRVTLEQQLALFLKGHVPDLEDNPAREVGVIHVFDSKPGTEVAGSYPDNVAGDIQAVTVGQRQLALLALDHTKKDIASIDIHTRVFVDHPQESQMRVFDRLFDQLGQTGIHRTERQTPILLLGHDARQHVAVTLDGIALDFGKLPIESPRNRRRDCGFTAAGRPFHEHILAGRLH